MSAGRALRPLALTVAGLMGAGLMTPGPAGAESGRQGAQDAAPGAPFALASLVAAPAVGGGVTLTGGATALTPGRYEARMRIEKTGAGGCISTTQGGAVTLAAGETGTIASVGLTLAPGDALAVELVVSAGGQEVSRSRLSVGE